MIIIMFVAFIIAFNKRIVDPIKDYQSLPFLKGFDIDDDVFSQLLIFQKKIAITKKQGRTIK